MNKPLPDSARDSAINMNTPRWKKQFFTMFSGQAASIIGSNVVQFAISLHLALKTSSPIMLTLAMLAGYLPQVIFGPFLGVLVDRINRKTAMILADMFIAASCAILMVWFLIAEPPFWLLFTVLMMRSIGQGFHEPAFLASVPLLVPTNQLNRVSGYRQAMDSIAVIASPSIAALMMSLMPIGYVMIFDIGGAIIASSILAFFIKIPNPPVPHRHPEALGFFRGLFKDMSLGMKELAKFKGLIFLAIALACAAFIMVPITTLFILFVTSHMGGGNAEVALIQSAFGIGMLVGSLMQGVFGRFKKKVVFICCCCLVMGAMLFVSSILPTDLFYVIVILAGCMGFLFPFMTGPFFAMLQTLIPPGVLGRVMAMMKSVTILATPVGLLVAGPVAEMIGVAPWFMVAGIFVTLLGVVCLTIPSIRGLDPLLVKYSVKGSS